MSEPHPTDRQFAIASLVLFISGPLVPVLFFLGILFSGNLFKGFMGAPNPNAAGQETAFHLSIGIGIVCEVLALVTGIAGRRHVAGKIGMIGSFVLLAWFGFIWAGNLILDRLAGH